MTGAPSIGFIGLGVMGAPICRNIITKSGAASAGSAVVFDIDPGKAAALSGVGARVARSIAEVAAADVIFLSLPGGREVAMAAADLLPHLRPRHTVVDTSTIPVGQTQRLAEQVAVTGARYADAPVARTRAAAEAGTLSIMVGAPDDLYAEIAPLLAHAASDITHCGPVGLGQLAKILNTFADADVAHRKAMLIGDRAEANTYPYIQVDNKNAKLEHEASTAKIGEEQLFYFAQRGISEEDAISMLVSGFCKDVLSELPMEFAAEADKLLSLKLEGTVG